MKPSVQLVDNSFSHVKTGYCCDFHSSENFYWKRNDLNSNDIIVYTDNFLNTPTIGSTEKSFAWLIEPTCILNHTYQNITKIENESRYSKIFTHDKYLLEKNEKYVLIPFGGSWIEVKDFSLYDKNKNISIVASKKNQTDGHKLRHEVINKFGHNIDLFGFSYNPISYKLESLKDYRFQIVVENCKKDYWFTEKLIDCFVTGTIPIYWGCQSIGNFFNTNGIITFNNLDELNDILNNINEEDYFSKIKSVEENFHLSKKYILPDEHIFQYLWKK